MKRLASILTLIAFTLTASWAAVPAAYYRTLEGKTGAELKNTVFQIVNPHTLVSSYQDLPRYFQQTDVYPLSRRWWDMYSDIQRNSPSFSGLNREHSFPKSWWGGLTDIPAYTDLNHLYPADGPANMAKSNYPLGEVSRASQYDNGVTRVGYPVAGQGGGAQYVFEPADEYKGDFARTYFYMVTIYQNLTWAKNYSWMVQQNSYPTLTPWAISLLLRWSREDPVSQKEIDRNEVVWGYQNNRNPFIDFPDLAEYIWGNKVGSPFTLTGSDTPAGNPELTAPVNDTYLDFGEVAIGQSVTANLFFKGSDITQPLSLSLSGTDKAYFSLPQRTISGQIVSAPSGYYLQITYTPQALGAHEAKILIYDGGLTGSRYVYLRGIAQPVPTLTALTALPAENVQSDRYTALWTPAPEGEIVDYYVITRQRYVGSDLITEEIEADASPYEVTDFSESDSESYYVQSSRLGFRSAPSNVIFVNRTGLCTLTPEEPLTATSYPGLIRIQCSREQTGGRIFDTAGRLILELPSIPTDFDLTLPGGVYILTTTQHPSPLKIVSY